MGRKRRAARETTGQDVLPVYYTKVDFEQLKRTIIDYADAIRSRNRDTNQRELSKAEVNQQFTIAVLSEYETAERECFELLGQVSYNQMHVSNSNLD